MIATVRTQSTHKTRARAGQPQAPNCATCQLRVFPEEYILSNYFATFKFNEALKDFIVLVFVKF